MKRFYLFSMVAIATVLSAAPADAQLAIGARAGTLGVGAEAGLGLLNSRIGLHGGVGVFPVEPYARITNVRYDFGMPERVYTAGVDLHVFSGLRLFGGYAFGLQELSITGAIGESAFVGDQMYTGEEIGNLEGVLRYEESRSPYAGIGFGSGLGKGFGMRLDLGAVFLGEPDFSLETDGLLADDPTFQANLAAERARIQEKLDKYGKYYPILNLSLRYAF